jgi:UDP-N-acetylmuramoyl-L-alanyl-D-glutamate--2,6-diaminopimelate ligase
MKLSDLLTEFPALDPRQGAIEIGGITADSRAVKPGYLFFAVPGSKADGTAFAGQAFAQGAAAVIGERLPAQVPAGGHFIVLDNVRRALALAAARFYPRQPATIVAVTGTAGKTSVAEFTRQIWQRLGHRAAYLGTLGIITADGAKYGSLTTPDPVELHRTLDRLAGEGITHLAIEASSHGLDQHRLDGLRLRAAAFTNLGRDHLDYHHTMEAYLAAKLRLIEDLLPPGATLVAPLGKKSDAGVDAALAAARQRGLATLTTLTYPGMPLPEGGDIRAMIMMEAVGATTLGQRLMFEPPYAGYKQVFLPLSGFFQASNALVAAGLAIATGDDPAAAIAALEHLQGVPGRLDLAGRKDGAGIFVDYAHKPEALGAALWALRPFVDDPNGRLIVVFGCGGDRDQGKRPLMGKIATERADVVIVTDDNPRSEKPETIRRAILDAAPGAIEIGNRAEAIRHGIEMLRAGDILLIAGKGHETGQIVGDRVLPFSDHDAVRAVLQEKVA